MESETNYQWREYQGPFIKAADMPVPADYNSDSKTDVAIWFSSTGVWHIVLSQTGEVRQEQFGDPNDVPVMAASVFR